MKSIYVEVWREKGSIFEGYLNLLHLFPDFILGGAVKKKLNH